MKKTIKKPKKTKKPKNKEKEKAREQRAKQREAKKRELREKRKEKREKLREKKLEERKEQKTKKKESKKEKETITEVSEKKHDRFSDRELIEAMISEEELSTFPAFIQSTDPSLQERGALPAPVRLETELEDVPGEATGEGNEPPYKVPDYAALTNSYISGTETERPAEFAGGAESVDYILPTGDPNMVRPNRPKFNNNFDTESWREAYVGKMEKPTENYEMGKIERKKEKSVFSFNKESDTLA